jgi:hypothetical protein
MADAFCDGMTPATIENLEIRGTRWRTREQAAELLAALRAAYQSLSAEGREQVKADILNLARFQSSNRQL